MKLANLITEISGRACNQWEEGTFQQGDGVKTPKITVTKTETEIVGEYLGPDEGGCIQRATFNDKDTPHQLAGITVFTEAAAYLKTLYKSGVFVKPNMKGITMGRVPNKSFKITIPLIKTTEDKAITSINERGGMGHSGDDTYASLASDIKGNPDHVMIEESGAIKARDITEHFISFRNIKNFPIKTKTSSETKPVEKSKETVKPAEKPKEEPKKSEKQKEAPKSQPVVNQPNGTYETPGKRFFLMYGKDNVLAEVGKTTDNDMQLKYVKIDGSKANIFGSFKYNKDKTAVVQVNDDGTPGQEFKILKF
jgi:hypothetical protein